ncbi:MAG: methyltransferase domain-containing protein [Planctomycetes bacterium]|nr:methyltransferase domain-containing protein [Planctomycetota bacterium]
MSHRSSSEPVVAYHDRIAARYDEIYSGPYWEFYRAVTWESWKGLLPRDLSSRALDLGCGTGFWGLRLAKSGYRVTLLDISPKMLDVARRKAEEAGLLARVDFVQADLCDLSELPDARYAFAVAEGDPLSYAADPARAAREVARLLIPGGILAASVDHLCAGLDFYVEKGDLAGLERFARDGVASWLAERPEERYPIRMFTSEGLRQMLERAGFEVLWVRGKTVLPLRKHPDLLSDPKNRDRLLRLELGLGRMEACLGRASHLQVAARKKGPRG